MALQLPTHEVSSCFWNLVIVTILVSEFVALLPLIRDPKFQVEGAPP